MKLHSSVTQFYIYQFGFSGKKNHIIINSSNIMLKKNVTDHVPGII